MKIIDTIIIIDHNGKQITSMVENIPDGTIYVEYTGGKYICYNECDVLPESYNISRKLFNSFSGEKHENL